MVSILQGDDGSFARRDSSARQRRRRSLRATHRARHHGRRNGHDVMRVRSFSAAVGKEGKLRKARESLQIINCGRVDSVFFGFPALRIFFLLLRWPQKRCPRTSRIELLGGYCTQKKTNKKKGKRSGAGATSRLRLVFYLLLKYFIYPNEEMAQQRSPRKSLQLNRANTPINVDGPMQDVNVSLSFLLLFMPTLRARAHWSHLSLSLLLSVD